MSTVHLLLLQDRENESRFGATPVPGKIGMAMAGRGLHAAPPPRPPHHDYFGQTGSNPGNQLYVGNVSSSSHPHCNFSRRFFQLPYQAGWQDLKDLFRSAGNIIRADINIGADGRPKGSGTVIFETAKDAQQAITLYHGFDWYGRTLEVREVSSDQHKALPYLPVCRIVMPASAAQERSEAAFGEGEDSGGSVVVGCEAG